MVELLVVLVEHVCVALDGIDVREFVNFEHQIVEGRKYGAGEGVFVEVACENDVHARVDVQDRLNECLRAHSFSLSHTMQFCWQAYGNGLDLAHAFCHVGVDGRTVVSLS